MRNFSLYKRLNNALDQRFGLRIQPSAEARLARCRSTLLYEMEIDCIFDVGANRGQYALRVRKDGFKGRIVSFEPTGIFHELLSNSENDDAWQTFNVALSDTEGESQIYISSNDFLSSSLLRPAKIKEEFPIHFTKQATVPVKKLMSFESQLGISNYLKLDVQGNEQKVLEGGIEGIKNFKAIEFESAVSPLYEGESTFMEISKFLESHEFIPLLITPTHWNESGALISLDCIFVRRDS